MFAPDVIAQALLDAVVGALGDTAPARRYRTAGMPAWDAQGFYLGDGEQITIGLLRIFNGQPGRPDAGIQPSPNYALQTAEFEVEVVRVVPTVTAAGTQPSASDMDASGVTRMQDILTIREALRSVSVPGFSPPLATTGHPAPIAMSVLLLGSQVKGPDGGMLGLSTMIQVGL